MDMLNISMAMIRVVKWTPAQVINVANFSRVELVIE